MKTSGDSCTWNWPVHACSVPQSCLTLCHLMNCSLSLSMEFSTQECWSGFPFTSPGDLPMQELTLSVKPPVLAGRFFTTEPPEKRLYLEFRMLVRKILWRRELQCTPVFLPGESQGQRSLAGYSPWGRTELDTTEQLTLLLLLNFIKGLLKHNAWQLLNFKTKIFPMIIWRTGGSVNKESVCNVGDPGLTPGLGRFPWRREWRPTPVFLPGEFHG